MDRRRVGIVVNPIAGMGGRVGLKGTDGPDVLARARVLGARPLAAGRCAEALAQLAPLQDRIRLIAPPGSLGEDAALAAGLPVERLAGLPEPCGDGTDTASAGAALCRAGVDLILFAGGDGTARDLVGAVGTEVPVLGVPTGVKMHSGVFGVSPAAAGRTAARFLDAPGEVRLREAEVMDLDEAALREGRVSARLFGLARVPYERGLMQASKAGARPDDEAALDALAPDHRARLADGPTDDPRAAAPPCGASSARWAARARCSAWTWASAGG